MRSIPFIAFAILAIVSGAAHADLGGADLNRVELYSSRRKYDALCGREKNKCVVTFKDGFFKVDNGDGIQKHQLIQRSAGGERLQEQVIATIDME